MLVALLGIVSVLTFGCIVVPLGLRARSGALRGSGSLLVFFLSIGLGFMFVEVSEMQRLMVLLGKPTYALSVVLFTLLVGERDRQLRRATGSRRPKGPKGALTALALVILVLAAVGLGTPHVVRGLVGSSTTIRIAAAAATLLPVGFFMGLPFPLGLRVAAANNPGIVPWLWGVNGAASVLCSVLATVVALSAGISAAFWLGVGCYCAALTAYAAATRTSLPGGPRLTRRPAELRLASSVSAAYALAAVLAGLYFFQSSTLCAEPHG